MISLNRYNKQKSSTNGLQVEIIEKEEKRQRTSVLPYGNTVSLKLLNYHQDNRLSCYCHYRKSNL
jgi:hypothetical protein